MSKITDNQSDILVAEEKDMNDNISLYLKVRKAFKEEILFELESRDISNEWNYFYHEEEGSLSYYRMILDCECYDGGFMEKDVHDSLLDVVIDNFYLLEDDYLDELENQRTDKKQEETLNESYHSIMEAGKMMKTAFDA